VKECPLRFDSPPEVLADWLDEHGWTADDVHDWLTDLVAALHVPAALPVNLPVGLPVTEREADMALRRFRVL
jgi:hypothetical protein